VGAKTCGAATALGEVAKGIRAAPAALLGSPPAVGALTRGRAEESGDVAVAAGAKREVWHFPSSAEEAEGEESESSWAGDDHSAMLGGPGKSGQQSSGRGWGWANDFAKCWRGCRQAGAWLVGGIVYRSFAMHLSSRPRRNRKSPGIRSLVRETSLEPGHLIYPLFIQEGTQDDVIHSMPGCMRWSLDGLLREAGEAHALGIPAVVLFPRIADELKTPSAEECANPEGLVPKAIRALKAQFPTLTVITDVALDPYNSDGHDGLVTDDGRIANDETIEVLCAQALCHAEAGADIVSPSDMMDGRVGAIREALDVAAHSEVSILSYCAKYASAYYGPFRGALDSAPRAGDKKTYQMDPANAREALREAALDEAEGADILMVKPAGPYLDIIADLRAATTLPVAAYQVSGEYLMIKAGAAAGWLDEAKIVAESLIGIRRAGADMILTYFAKDIAKTL
jgi:porphobilinogen synthase